MIFLLACSGGFLETPLCRGRFRHPRVPESRGPMAEPLRDTSMSELHSPLSAGVAHPVMDYLVSGKSSMATRGLCSKEITGVQSLS